MGVTMCNLVALPPQSPGAQISLYNAVIEHLARRACDDRLQELSWPITELSLEQDGKSASSMA